MMNLFILDINMRNRYICYIDALQPFCLKLRAILTIAESAMSGTELFSHVWSEEIWREIQPEYEQLCSTMPQRIQEKATKRLQENAQKKDQKDGKKQKKERKEEGDDDGEEDVEAIANKILEKKMKDVMDEF